MPYWLNAGFANGNLIKKNYTRGEIHISKISHTSGAISN